jgi:hypothetical protein
MNDCGDPATSDSSTPVQSSPIVLSMIAHPWSSGFASRSRSTSRYVVFQIGTSLT